MSGIFLGLCIFKTAIFSHILLNHLKSFEIRRVMGNHFVFSQGKMEGKHVKFSRPSRRNEQGSPNLHAFEHAVPLPGTPSSLKDFYFHSTSSSLSPGSLPRSPVPASCSSSAILILRGHVYHSTYTIL